MRLRFVCMTMVIVLALSLLSGCDTAGETSNTPSGSAPSLDTTVTSPTPSAYITPTSAEPSPSQPSDDPVSLPPVSQTPDIPPVTTLPTSITPSPSLSVSVEPTQDPSPSHEPTPEYPVPSAVFTGYVSSEHPALTFEIYSSSQGGIYRAQRLVVICEGVICQDIDLTEYSSDHNGITGSAPEMDFAFFDMDFDGLLDFRVRDYVTATPNNKFLVFLWDNDEGGFIFSPELSALSNPEFDETAGFIHSRIVVLPDIVESGFTFEYGKLVLQTETLRHLDAELRVWAVTVSVRIDGVMTVTEQYEEPSDEDPSNSLINS